MKKKAEKLISAFSIALIDVYKLFVSPILGRNCRFSPECSTYAVMVIKLYGPWRGGWMAFKRIMRCHPWSQGGSDYPPMPH